MEKITEAWGEYQKGIDFKNAIALYKTVAENISFNEGDQWKGISAPNLPTPVFNIIKPAGKFMAVQIKDRKLTMGYTAEGTAVTAEVKAITRQMTEYAKITWNRLKMEYKNLEGLIDAFVTGDYILYHWWSNAIETGQPFAGDIDSMIIDNVNYYPGNPNSNDVQGQPYIILVMRELVKNVKAEAKENKVSGIDQIVPDDDTDYTAGDMGKIEIDDSSKCNVLLKMWKQDGEVWFAKYTKYVEIQKPKNAKLKLYPVSMMNWNTRKNCCHGVAEATYLKSNQVYLNKQMAFTQLYLLQTAYPKCLYNKTVIPEWTNKVAAAIGVNGDVEQVAKYLQPPQIPFDVWKGFETTLTQTMELIGVNDAALGNIANPDNKSAFIAIREAAIVPLQAQQERFHQMMRDTGLIWLDFWVHHYGDGRNITIEDDQGAKIPIPFETNKYTDLVFDAQVEVGESQMWSEYNTVQTLDNLMMNKQITFKQYLKRMPQGYIPEREALITEVEAEEKIQQQIMQQQAQQQQQQEIPEEVV